MEKKTDLRILKTYKALTETFLQMLGEKRFEDITVNELCERAMVRRATFYKHFADKYEFFAFVIRELQTQFDAQSQPYLDRSKPQSFYLAIIRNVLDFLKVNDKLVQTVLGSKMLPTLLDILAEQITLDITQKLKDDVKNGATLPAVPEIMATFFTGALIHTVKWWVTRKVRMPEEKLIAQLTMLLSAFPANS